MSSSDDEIAREFVITSPQPPSVTCTSRLSPDVSIPCDSASIETCSESDFEEAEPVKGHVYFNFPTCSSNMAPNSVDSVTFVRVEKSYPLVKPFSCFFTHEQYMVPQENKSSGRKPLPQDYVGIFLSEGLSTGFEFYINCMARVDAANCEKDVNMIPNIFYKVNFDPNGFKDKIDTQKTYQLCYIRGNKRIGISESFSFKNEDDDMDDDSFVTIQTATDLLNQKVNQLASQKGEFEHQAKILISMLQSEENKNKVLQAQLKNLNNMFDDKKLELNTHRRLNEQLEAQLTDIKNQFYSCVTAKEFQQSVRKNVELSSELSDLTQYISMTFSKNSVQVPQSQIMNDDMGAFAVGSHIRNSLQEIETLLQSKDKMLNDLKNEQCDLKHQLQQLQGVSEVRDLLTKKVEDLISEIDSLRCDLTALSQENRELKIQLGGMKELQTKFDELTETVDKYAADLDESNIALAESDRLKINLEAEISDRVKDHQFLTKQLLDVTNTSNQKLDEKIKIIESLQDEVEIANNMCQMNKEFIDKQSETFESMRDEKRQLLDRITDLEKKLEMESASRVFLENEKAQLLSQNQKLKFDHMKQIAECRKEFTSLQAKCKSLESMTKCKNAESINSSLSNLSLSKTSPSTEEPVARTRTTTQPQASTSQTMSSIISGVPLQFAEYDVPYTGSSFEIISDKKKQTTRAEDLDNFDLLSQDHFNDFAPIPPPPQRPPYEKRKPSVAKKPVPLDPSNEGTLDFTCDVCMIKLTPETSIKHYKECHKCDVCPICCKMFITDSQESNREFLMHVDRHF